MFDWVDRLSYLSVCCLVGLLIGWLVGWLVGLRIYLLFMRFTCLRVCVLVDRFSRCFVYLLMCECYLFASW